MTIRVGSAKLGENGRITGGKVGDQTRREVATEDYYIHSKGWNLFRPINPDVADRIANAMLSACNNENIGYDQSNRLGVINALKKYGKISRIAEKTEADCSSLVRACCIEAGFDPGNFSTSGEAARLAATGKFEPQHTVARGTTVYNGDILVTKTKGHTVIVVSGNPRPKNTPKPNAPKAEAARYKDGKLVGTYEVANCSALSLRTGARKTKELITTMKAGSEVQCYGFYNMAGTTKWLYVVYTDKAGKKYTGYASSKYLNKQ